MRVALAQTWWLPRQWNNCYINNIAVRTTIFFCSCILAVLGAVNIPRTEFWRRQRKVLTMPVSWNFWCFKICVMGGIPWDCWTSKLEKRLFGFWLGTLGFKWLFHSNQNVPQAVLKGRQVGKSFDSQACPIFDLPHFRILFSGFRNVTLT